MIYPKQFTVTLTYSMTIHPQASETLPHLSVFVEGVRRSPGNGGGGGDNVSFTYEECDSPEC